MIVGLGVATVWWLLRVGSGPVPRLADPGPGGPASVACDPDNGGLVLPDGLCARLVADGVGFVRHLAVAPNGDLFAARVGRAGSGVVLLRDTDGDGTLDKVIQFYQGAGGSGLVLTDRFLYFAQNDQVLRFEWKPGADAPIGEPVVVAKDLPAGGHASKGLALKGNDLFVSFGSRSNSCQKPDEDRKGPFPGEQPCSELPIRAGIWRFKADGVRHTPADAEHWATGMRNPMAMSVEPATGLLYMATHGRDQLAENWSWPAEEGRENPAEEFGPAARGADYGWPYCFFDPRKKAKLLNPEYGGDGEKAGDCGSKTQPAIGFPAHWAPNGLMFYTGSMLPSEYRGGAFLAFHGSWNRAPAPQQGYRVVFIPFSAGKPTGKWRDFARPAGAEDSIRPTGLAQGPDGALYIGADQQGKIWRVTVAR